MTVRDQFAAAALPALVASAMHHNQYRTPGSFFYVEFDEVAGKAYAIADAMIKARDQ